jgi:5-methylthioadenosine/S-adenosylhomocysteine deaminase
MSSKVLFKNFTIVTPNADGEVQAISNASVAVHGTRIVYVGLDPVLAVRTLMESHNESDGTQIGYDEYSGYNKILMPTFANAHTHIPMVLLRNTADDLSLENWLFHHILPLEEHLTKEDIYYASLLGMAEMIHGGTGASADMYFMSDETARAALETGFRMNLCHDGKFRNEKGWSTDRDGLKSFKKSYHGAGNGLLRTSLMIHSVYLYPKDLYPDLVSEAAEMDVSIQVHISETRTEVENCIAQYGVTPVAALSNFGIFNQPCIAAHGVHLTDADRDILAAARVTVAHNPSSNMKLASGIADVEAMRRQGVRVAIGTDGCASNNNTDMYIEMRLASFLAKGKSHDPTYLPACEAIMMATRNGYMGMGFSDCGMIAEGMSADLQIIDCDRPSMCPLGNPISAIVFSACASAVESVMISGHFVKYKGELTTIDIEKVKAETRKRSEILMQFA